MGSSTRHGKQFLSGHFSLAKNNNIRSGVEIFRAVGSRFRPANQGLPTRFFCHAQNFEHVRASHQVGINAEDRRRSLPENFNELVAGSECGIENFYLKSFSAQMRRNVKNAQRGIWLHDLKFLWVVK